MGWVIFGLYLYIGLLLWALNCSKDSCEKDSKEYKITSKIIDIIIGIVIVTGGLLVIYGIILFWYYFCGGGLIFEVAETAGDVVCYTFASVFVLLVVLSTVIMMLKEQCYKMGGGLTV